MLNNKTTKMNVDDGNSDDRDDDDDDDDNSIGVPKSTTQHCTQFCTVHTVFYCTKFGV